MTFALGLGGMTLMLSGCATSDLNTYGSFQPAEKTVAVPSGGEGLTGNIKEMLHQEGWNLVIQDARKGMEISWEDKLTVEQYAKHPTRYKMIIDSYRIIGSLYQYDVSVIDLREGREVLTMSGTGTADKIVSEFRKAVSQ